MTIIIKNKETIEIKKILNWRAKINLDEGLKKTIKYFNN